MSEQRLVLGDILFAFAEYYDKRLTPMQMSMYVQDLSVLSPEELTLACKMYRSNIANDRFPLPAKLIGLVRPVQSAEDAGREISASIFDALHRDGKTNPERARERMGETGWSIIQRMGGWQCFCAEVTNENLTTYRAQIRELAATMCRVQSRHEALKELPDPEGQKKVLGLMAGVFRAPDEKPK